MSEAVKIAIQTSYDDAAAKKALKDEEALKKGGTTAAGATTGHTAASKQLAAEQLITKEKEKQHAVSKAQAGHHKMSAGRMIGDSLDAATGQSGWVMRTQQLGNLMHMIKAAPMLAIPAIIAGAAVGFLALRKGEEAKDNMEQHRIGQARLDTDLRVARMGRFGNSEEAFSMQLDAADEQKKLQAKRSELVDKAHSGLSGAMFGNFFEKGNSFFKGETAREIEKNDHDQQEAIKAQRQAQIVKKEWWSKVGKRELEIAKAEASGNRAASRGIQDELTAVQEYQRLDKDGASTEEIHQGVVAKLQNVQRERAGKLAGLVTARDGAADTAAVAREAMAQRSGGGAEAIWNKIHGTMEKQHSEAMGAATRKNFSRA